MKKVLFVITVLFLSTLVFAQEAEVEQEKSVNIEVVTNETEQDSVTNEAAEVQNETAAVGEETEATETEDSQEQDLVAAGEESQEPEEPIDERALAEAAALEAYEIAKEEYEENVENIKEYYLELFKEAKDKKETVEAELGQQMDILAEYDALKLAEEAVYAARRSDEDTLELNRRKSAIDFLMTEKTAELSQKIGPEENMMAVEAIKASIWDLRENVRVRAEAYNAEKDAETEKKVADITNAPYAESETDSSGEPTRTALQRRSNNCIAVRAAAETEKETYLKQLNAEIAPAEKQYFSELAAAYKVVEAGKYVTNSFCDDVIFRVGNFNGEKGYWKATVTSAIFNHTDLMNLEFNLTYEEVTGKPFKPADQLTDEEFAEFKSNVALYDYLFRTNANVIFAKVYFTMYHWREASEYRFTPSKLEVVKIGDPVKVIHKENRIQSKAFIFYDAPVHEVRSESAIEKDVQRASKIVEREQKKAGTYNPAYSYDGSSTNSLVEQKGRGAVAITAATVIPSGNFEKIKVDNVSAEVTFGLGKYAFAGGDYSIYFPVSAANLNMEYGVVAGANCKLGQYVRPYIKGTANMNNHEKGIVKAGGGLDFTIGLFMINVAYDYGWYFDLNKKDDNIQLSTKPIEQNHKISVGLGIAF